MIKLLRSISIYFLSLLVLSCEEEMKDINSIIVGKWQLSEFHTGHSKWIKVEDPTLQIKEFRSDGKYLFKSSDQILCKGNYALESDSTIRLEPEIRISYTESIELIYSLSTDTLIISNYWYPLLSYERKEKHFRID
jgi:hypothetical protein